PEHRRATRLITHFIANYHYRKTALDDDLSRQIFNRYLDTLDPMRSYLLADDIANFRPHESRLDDYLRNSNLDPVFEVFVRYRERVDQRTAYAVELLDSEFDFTVTESYEFDREDAAWATTEAELNELWRKRVKNDVLSLKLASKEPDDIKETLTRRYEGIARRTAQVNSEDVFQMFVNAYTTSIDPHTAYFSPRTSENFKIRMSLSLEGIGAVLQSENEYTLVRQVVPGGPADKSGKLASGDRITGIGQQDEEEIVDVVGWRLDDVVDLIRGPKDTVVRLQVLPKDSGPEGPTRVISLTRNKIQLEEQAAQREVFDLPSGDSKVRIGVIEVPAFYMDFEGRARGEPDFRSTTRDVRKLLQELDSEEVNGIIIDLRGNGGGSLSEATDLTGLFIDKGPVVQVRNSSGRVQLQRDTDPGVAYNGPLAVLVDRHSASASEIFAGAIQDYGRGLVVGEPTFGKGTVQNLVDLNRFDKSMDGKLGQLKATIAQFFRVAGASTQHRGVVPDINLPTALTSDDQGERSLDNALPWAEIDPVRFRKVSAKLPPFERVRTLHEARVSDDLAFSTLLDAEEAISAVREKTTVSLVESERRADQERTKKEARKRENNLRIARGLAPLPDEDPDAPDAEDAAADDADDDDEDAYDVILHEATRIMRDFINVNGGTGKQLVEHSKKPALGLN
ncbi:MAG: carboxy terminal-processing peptidase, partial [Gammaproteobacteria bacterium]|nr:carboxy terminal-processing peptidase [Gammaproteobacteria bacterium]